jgi:endogenous inhibitor of DNA gyrase (YacG/DUF329 family)
MKHYNNDPKQMTAKFNSTCPTCQKRIKKGDNIYYWPIEKKAYCADCGEKDFSRFLLEAQDEETLASQYPNY